MEKLKKETGVKAELKPSGGGVFEVTVDGNLVYSKRQTGRFPDETALVDKIKSL